MKVVKRMSVSFALTHVKTVITSCVMIAVHLWNAMEKAAPKHIVKIALMGKIMMLAAVMTVQEHFVSIADTWN